MVKKLTAFCLTALVAIPSFAQMGRDSVHADAHLYYKELNYLDNLYEGTSNPVALSHNRVRTIADAYFNSDFRNGNFHDADEGRKSRNLGASINGLQNFGKLDVSGYFEYVNAKDFARRWNSTLFVDSNNPFILADEIASDVSTELFKMSAAASYQFNDWFTGALSLFYKTGSASDQTDPRPKTNAMHVEINPGVEFQLNAAHRIGVSGLVDIFRSDMSYSVVNNNNNYVYYVMKGMGDFMVRTSNDLASYPRDYEGTRYHGALQWTMAPVRKNWSNLLEVGYEANREVSEDGGYAYTFKSGDYKRSKLTLSDRFRWKHSDRLQQNFILSMIYGKDQGDWYDQKKMVDTEHGNTFYYQILNKSKIRETTSLDAQLSYQLDGLRNHLPDWSLHAVVAFNRMDAKQYFTSVFKQNYNKVALKVGASKFWNTGKMRFSAKINGFYATPVGDTGYACIQPELNEEYMAPKFEYASSARIGFDVQAAAYVPVTVYHYKTWMGVNLRVSSSFYQGDQKYTSLFSSASKTWVDASFNIKF